MKRPLTQRVTCHADQKLERISAPDGIWFNTKCPGAGFLLGGDLTRLRGRAWAYEILAVRFMISSPIMLRTWPIVFCGAVFCFSVIAQTQGVGIAPLLAAFTLQGEWK